MELADLYRDHVAHLNSAVGTRLAAAGFDALVIATGSAAKRNLFDDQYWPLRRTPAFAHFSPIAEPDAYIIVRPGRRPELWRTLVQDYWDAVPAPPPPWQVAPFDAHELRPEQLPTWPAGRVAFVTTSGAPLVGDLNPVALLAALDDVRTRKTDYEVACLQEASTTALRGHAACAAQFAAGESCELALHLAYLQASAQGELSTPYQNIVALGEHAAVLHWIDYEVSARPQAQSLLVDAGASCRGYGSDITRTLVRGTDADAQLFRALLAEMEVVQQAVCARIAPGLPYEDLHDYAHELIAAMMVRLGLATGSVDSLVATGITRAFFPHGLGHSLGIQTHDVGMKLTPPRANNPFLRNTSVITERQVFTIEPGFYFIEQLLAPVRAHANGATVNWAMVTRLARFGGIRIEDNVLVTKTGHRNLTREAAAA